MSGRAWAVPDITTPAPMVAASATAILSDIMFSSSLPPPQRSGQKSQTSAKRRLAYVFLTACVNQTVSTRAVG